MTLHRALVLAHVLVAILGVGQLSALALLSGAGRRARIDPKLLAPSLEPLFRNTRIALALMLVTGIGLDHTVAGGWHHFWWFRASVLLLVLTAVIHQRARRQLGRADGSAARIERAAWAMCGSIGVITALMELKPL